MKTIISLLAIGTILFSCQSNPQEIATNSNQSLPPASSEIISTDSSQTSLEPSEPSEQFSGKINGASVTFGHYKYQRYRLTEAGKTTEGELNTERGHGPDRNATVFVLNPFEEESKQRYFVRYTGGRFTALDSSSKEIAGADFTKN